MYSFHVRKCHSADFNAGQRLSEQVEEALTMLETYNKRLSEEMEARKAVARMLHDYIAYQKDLLAQAEEKLEVRYNVLFMCRVNGHTPPLASS